MPSSIAGSSAVINTSTSGDNTIVAAVSGASTRVYALRLSVAGTVTVTVKRGSTTLDIITFLAAGTTIVDLPLREVPYYQTANNEAFVLNLSGAVQVYGRIEYTVA